jgi:hypothetical protein
MKSCGVVVRDHECSLYWVVFIYQLSSFGGLHLSFVAAIKYCVDLRSIFVIFA